jgi:ferredoxin
LLKKSKGLKSKLIELNKFEINSFQEELADQALKIIPKVFKTVQKAKKDYLNELKNPPDNVDSVSKEFWEEIIEQSKNLGIDLIGFTPVDENLIFEEDHVNGIEYLYKNGIVLGMEMNYEAIDTAPDPPAGLESLNIYAELGEATNKLADFIRSKGYRVIACHPLGGPILYPAMAVKAGLGEIGKQGLLITKKFGPRQRLSMIAINAEPLPDISHEDFNISRYCEKCRRCIQLCPVEAIYDHPIQRKSGNISRIDGEKCIEYFYETTGCSVCIQVCPFHKIGYKVMYYSRL